MPFNPFIGKSRVWLEAELATLQDDLVSGRTTISAGAGDVTSQDRLEVNIYQRIEQVLYALYLIDPVAYPRETITRTRRTTPRYIWGS